MGCSAQCSFHMFTFVQALARSGTHIASSKPGPRCASFQLQAEDSLVIIKTSANSILKFQYFLTLMERSGITKRTTSQRICRVQFRLAVRILVTNISYNITKRMARTWAKSSTAVELSRGSQRSINSCGSRTSLSKLTLIWVRTNLAYGGRKTTLVALSRSAGNREAYHVNYQDRLHWEAFRDHILMRSLRNREVTRIVG